MNNFTVSVFSLAFMIASLQAQEEQAADQTNSNTASTAGSSLQVGTKTDQERIDFLVKVGAVYMEEKDMTSAISAFKRVLDLEPDNRQARILLSHAYLQSQQTREAVGLLNQLIEDYPEDFQLKNNLAWLYATAPSPEFRDGEKAIKLAQEAMVLAPNDHHIWSTLSEAYYVSGEYEKANRAILQMASLVTRYDQGIDRELIDNYNEQLRKCRRAWETQQALQEEDSETPPSSSDP